MLEYPSLSELRSSMRRQIGILCAIAVLLLMVGPISETIELWILRHAGSDNQSAVLLDVDPPAGEFVTLPVSSLGHEMMTVKTIFWLSTLALFVGFAIMGMGYVRIMRTLARGLAFHERNVRRQGERAEYFRSIAQKTPCSSVSSVDEDTTAADLGELTQHCD